MEGTHPAKRLRGGIDLGGTKIDAIVVDSRNQVLGQAREPTPTDGGPADVAEQMAEALRGAAKEAGVKSDSLRGVGVGSPGDVDEETGVVANARNLPNWIEPFELGQALSDALGTPVVVGNDVQVATQAEFKLGAGKPYKSLLGVFWGTGVGGGLILNGKPWLGRGGAGEIGHMVVRRDGAHCPCGAGGGMGHMGVGRAGGPCPWGAAAAWRPTRVAPRWRRALGARSRRAPRPTCS